MQAYCFRSGQIEFGNRLPKGALPIADGDPPRLQEVIDATARHSYDGKTLLVPGIPEAGTNDAKAMDALLAYRDFVGKRDGIRITPRETAA